MSAEQRNREGANEIARRAIAAAERRARDEPDFAERLRQVADADGRLDVDTAVEALSTAPERKPWNPFHLDPDERTHQ